MNIEEIKQKLLNKEIKVEKIPALIQRCPKCRSLSLEFDIKTGRIYCAKCGFQEHVPVYKPG